MNLASVTEKIPIEKDKDGVIRVGNTRVTLETLVSAFNGGSTAEEMIYQFPVLNLADVYAVITYYLRNRDTVEKYLNNRMQLAKQVKQRNQGNKNMNDVRKRLLARQNQQKLSE
ncbi:MAG: DUF433 domain-containing protein [Deltaproteobacteria bacterium]|nr:DUF433 domain-containing protein [Deltaproteobacteria bacterium]